jgi:hypothetical protein
MHNRLTFAAMALAFAVVSFNCGSPTTKTDAGTGGGTGGATGGGGGGSTGGGTGGGSTGGGTGRTCTAAPAFAQSDLVDGPGFDPGSMTSPPFNFATLARDAGAGRVDISANEYYANGLKNAVTIPAKNYQDCDLCFIVETNCNAMGAQCSKAFLAQGGTLTVTAATKSPDAGTYAFSLTNVTYEEWDFNNDVPADGGCLTLPSLSFTGTWP